MTKIPITVRIEIEVGNDEGADIQIVVPEQGEGAGNPLLDYFDLFRPRDAFPTYPAYSKLARLNGRQPMSLKEFQVSRQMYFDALDNGEKHDIINFREKFFLDEWEKKMQEEHDNDLG